jgi:hypothetical protein
MTIDPRVGFYLSIVLAMIGFMAGAGTQLTTLFGPDMANKILAVCVMVLGAGSAVSAVLHAIPSKAGAINEFPLGPKT